MQRIFNITLAFIESNPALTTSTVQSQRNRYGHIYSLSFMLFADSHFFSDQSISDIGLLAIALAQSLLIYYGGLRM